LLLNLENVLKESFRALCK